MLRFDSNAFVIPDAGVLEVACTFEQGALPVESAEVPPSGLPNR